MTTVAAGPILTAEEYAERTEDGRRTELIRGGVVEVNVPTPRHGQICSKIDRILGNHADAHRLGHVVTNDSAVVTTRGPDSVRGADVAFYSFARLPPGPLPAGYLTVVPELVFEVRSPTDRWSAVLAKVAEYLEAGVSVVCVLDQMTESVMVYQVDELPRTLHNGDELHLPGVLGEFRVAVSRFFA